jgi:hypothetical protein
MFQKLDWYKSRTELLNFIESKESTSANMKVIFVLLAVFTAQIVANDILACFAVIYKLFFKCFLIEKYCLAYS